jgi:hypothetical protein
VAGRAGAVTTVVLWAPTVAFFVLAGSLLAGTAAVAQRYGGAWWLWLTFLVLGVFTIVLIVLRWLTCLGPAGSERGATPPPVGPEEREQEHLAGTHARG